MQISKLSSVLWAAAVCASLNSVCAQDNPAQAAARAALMEQMNGAQTPPAQPPPDATPPATAPEPPAAPAPAPAAPATTPAQPEASTPNPPAIPAAPEPAPVVPADMQPATTVPAAADSTPENTEAQAKARAALLEQMQTQNPPPTAAPTASVVPAIMPKTNAVAAQPPMKKVQPKPAPPVVTKQAVKAPDFTPIVAPPLPISMTKEQQLQALNAKYMANQISPQEYFKQRETILAEPDAMSH